MQLKASPRIFRLKQFTGHAVFPLVVYVMLTQVLRENYPFSHYPMYSKPNSESLDIQFITDGDGKPIPVVWHTGITPSKVSKLMGNRLKAGWSDRDAALDVLVFLRKQNAGRRGRLLPDKIKLMETSIAIQSGKVVESQRVLAEDSNPAKP